MGTVIAKRSAEVVAAVQEFFSLADAIGMPAGERHSVLGLTTVGSRLWQCGLVDLSAPVPPGLQRRLDYALPLLRRMAAHRATAPSERVARTAYQQLN